MLVKRFMPGSHPRWIGAGWDNSLIGQYDPCLSPGATTARQSPPVNIWSDSNGHTLEVKLPGVDPQTVDVSVEGDVVRISGERHVEDKNGHRQIRRELQSGKFERRFRLPHRVDVAGVTATYVNGILTVLLPLAEEEKPKTIAVEAA